MGFTREPMATPSTCSKNWPWKEKYVFFRQNFNSRLMSSTPMTVQSLRVGSFCNRSSIIFKAGSIGTNVKRADTS